MDLRNALRVRHIRFQQESGDAAEIRICCIMGCGDLRFRMGINLRDNIGHCFNCGWSSATAIQDVVRELHISAEVEATVEDEPSAAVQEPLVDLPDDFVLLARAGHNDPLVNQAREYLMEDRNVSSAQIVEKRIGVSLAGRYAYRVVFPMWTGFQLLGFTARDFTLRQQTKYLHNPGPKYMYNRMDDAHCDVAIISEGPLDALSIERAGVVPDCLATLGHHIMTDTQREQLRRYKHLVFWPDPDKVGIQGFIECADAMSATHKVSMIRMPAWWEKDPGDMTPAEIQDYFRPVAWSASLSMRMSAELAFR